MLAMLALIALADPVTIFPGIQIGDTPQEVARIIDGQLIDMRGQPGSQLYNGREGHVLFCDGKAVSIQKRIGRDLHAYTDSVQDRTADYGEPTMDARHYRTPSAEISTIGAEWEIGENIHYSLGVLVNGDGLIEVTEQLAVTGYGCE